MMSLPHPGNALLTGDKLAAYEQQQKPAEAISTTVLVALQARLESLHQAKLLTDEELYSLEDLSADFLEVKSTVGLVTHGTVHISEPTAKLLKLVVRSEGTAADGAFSRQVRRKYL